MVPVGGGQPGGVGTWDDDLMPTYPINGSVTVPLTEIRSIVDYGAVGDGVTDDTEAIQAAVNDGPGCVFVPGTDAYWRVTRSVYMQSGVNLYGEGHASFIKNDNTVIEPGGVNFGTESCVVLGTGHPFNIDGSPTYYPCADVVQGSGTVTLSNAGDAAQFQPGDIVFVRTVADPSVGFEELWGQFNRVVAVSGPDLTLFYGIDESASGCEICELSRSDWGTSGPGYGSEPSRILDRAGLRGLRFQAPGNWNQQGGSFECTFEDLIIEPSSLSDPDIHEKQALLVWNCLCYSTIRNVRGAFSNRAIEVKYHSQSSLIENIVATYHPDPHNVVTGSHIIDVAEGAKDVTIRDITIYANGWDSENNSLQGGTFVRLGGRDNRISNATFYGGKADVLVYFPSHGQDNAAIRARNALAEDLLFRGAVADDGVEWGISPAGYPYGCTVRGMHVADDCTLTHAALFLRGRGERMVIENSTFAVGGIWFEPTALPGKGCIVRNNYIDGGVVSGSSAGWVMQGNVSAAGVF